MLPIATQFNSFLRFFLLLDPKFELLVVVCRVLHVSRGKGGSAHFLFTKDYSAQACMPIA